MLRSIAMFSRAAAIAGATLFGLSPALAQNPPGSLFICGVSAADGGCANGGSRPPGFLTFTFSGITDGDSFINGLPATSPTQRR
jgi:hypothetical protein